MLPRRAGADRMPHVVVMVTTSYPRFPGDSVGTFMEPIATSVAARGHEVHVVAPWHPLVTAAREEHGVHFHFYKYAPVRCAERVRLRGGAARRRQPARRRLPRRAAGARGRLAHGACASRGGTRDGHARPLGDPGGVIAAAAAPGAAAGRQPARIGRLRRRDARAGAPRRRARSFARAGRVTACSDDLGTARDRARRRPGAARDRALRRRRDALPARPASRARGAAREPRHRDARAAALRRRPAGPEEGVRVPDRRAGRDCRRARRPARSPATAISTTSCAQRARPRGVADRVRFLGNLSQDEVAALARGRRHRRACRRCGTTAATSTGCRTSCSRRWRPARRS